MAADQIYLNRMEGRTLVVLSLSLGLRISEALGFKWSDIDWLGKTIRIKRGVVKGVVDKVKTSHSARSMACADEVLEMLKNWRQTTQFSGQDDWIFASPVQVGRKPVGYTWVWRSLRKAAEQAGITDISSHSMRRTHRMWLDSVGTPMGVQQRLIRHADIRTTMNVYGDAATADMRNAHEKVAKLILPQASQA